MDTRILSYADEILLLEMEEPFSREDAEVFLYEMFGLNCYESWAVLDVLEGEGYFDGQ